MVSPELAFRRLSVADASAIERAEEPAHARLRRCAGCRQVEEFSAAVRCALATNGPLFINAKVAPGTMKVPVTMTYGKYNQYTIIKHIEEFEA